MEISTVNLWTTSVLVSNLELDRDFLNNLESFLLGLKQDDELNLKRSNEGGWHSDYNLYSHNNLENKEIHKKVNDIITWLYTRNNDTFFEGHSLTMNSWANVNSQHSYHTSHTHPEFALSAVFYVKVPEVDEGTKNGSLSFQDFSSRTMNPNFDSLKNILGEREKFLRVKTSDLVIFPSYLPHSVPPTYVSDPRITIAFNYMAVKN